MLQLTDTVTALAHDVSDTVATLAHEVASKAQDAAQVAGDRGKEWSHVAGKQGREWSQVATKQGKKAVKAGRQSLQSAGALPKPSHKGRNLLVLALLAVIAVIAWKASGRKDAAAAGGAPQESDRAADKNHLPVA